MAAVTRAGAIVLPAMPGWYHRPRSLDDLVDFVVARICDQLGVEVDLMDRWGRGPEDPSLTSRPTMVDAATRELLGMIKFSHTLFALPFALLGRGPGGEGARRLAGAVAGLAGDPALHGDGPVGGDGVQPAGRPADRRPEPPDGDPAPARAGGSRRRRSRRSRSSAGWGSSPRPCCSCPTAGP